MQPDQAGQYDAQATAQSITYVDGTNGQAWHMGTAGLVRIANSPDLEPVRSPFRPGSAGPPTRPLDTGSPKCTTAPVSLLLGFYAGSGNGAVFFIKPSPSTTILSPAAAAGKVWDNHWHQITGIYDGGAVRLYLDGAQVRLGTRHWQDQPTTACMATAICSSATSIPPMPTNTPTM